MLLLAGRLDLRRAKRGVETLCMLDGILFLELFFLFQSDHAFRGSVELLSALFVSAAAMNLGFLLLFEMKCRRTSPARDAETVSRISGIAEKVVILDLWICVGMWRRSVSISALGVNLLVGILMVLQFSS